MTEGILAHIMEAAMDEHMFNIDMMDEDLDEFYDHEHIAEHVHIMAKRLCEDPTSERAETFNKALSACLAEHSHTNSHIKGHVLLSVRRILCCDLYAKIICSHLDWDFFRRMEPFMFAGRTHYQRICETVCISGGPQRFWLQMMQRYLTAINEKKFDRIAAYLGILADVGIKCLKTSNIYDYVDVILRSFDDWIPLMSTSTAGPYPDWDADFNAEIEDEFFDDVPHHLYYDTITSNCRRDIAYFLACVAKAFAAEESLKPTLEGPRRVVSSKSDPCSALNETENIGPDQSARSDLEDIETDELMADAGDDEPECGSSASDFNASDSNIEPVRDKAEDSADDQKTVEKPFLSADKASMKWINQKNRILGKRLLLTMAMRFIAKQIQVTNVGASPLLMRNRCSPYVLHPAVQYRIHEVHRNHSVWIGYIQDCFVYLNLGFRDFIDHLVDGRPDLQLADGANVKHSNIGAFIALVFIHSEVDFAPTFLASPYLSQRQLWMVVPVIRKLFSLTCRSEGVGDLLLQILIVHQSHVLGDKRRPSASRLMALKKLFSSVLHFSANCKIASVAAAAQGFVASCLKLLAYRDPKVKQQSSEQNSATDPAMLVNDEDDDFSSDYSYLTDDDEDWSESDEAYYTGVDNVSASDLLWKYGPTVMKKAKEFIIQNETLFYAHGLDPEWLHSDDGWPSLSIATEVWTATDVDDLQTLRAKVAALAK